MCDPKELEIDLLPLKEVFIKSDEITPNHILYDQYLNYIENRPLPKTIFYIVMAKAFGTTHVDYTRKDKSAGYYLKFNEKLIKEDK